MPAANSNPLVRVLDNDTGHKITIRTKALRYGNYTVLKDEPALDHNGEALPPEYATRPSSPVDEDEPGANDQGETATKNGYDAQTVDELKDEISRRNTERPADRHVQVKAPANKPQLVAALVADDELLSNPN